MKSLLLPLLLFTITAQAGVDLAPGVLYPQISGDWQNIGPPPAPSSPAEITPGHFYLLHPIAGKKLTGLYHTTTPDRFDPGSTKTNAAALNLVTELPLLQAMIQRKNDQWFFTGIDPVSKHWKTAPVRWNEIQATQQRKHEGPTVRVALFDDFGSFGKGVPRCTELLGQEKDIAVTLVKPALIREGGLKDFDVVIFTGGSGGKQAGTLGLVGREQVRRFVEDGGGYIGICAGNYLACDGFSWGLKILDAQTKSSKWARGAGDVKIEFTPKGREILGMSEGLQDIRYVNGPVFDLAGNDAIDDFEPLAYFRSELAKNGSPKGVQINSPAMVIGTYGKGRVLCSSPHPEQQAGMEPFISRAVRWAADNR